MNRQSTGRKPCLPSRKLSDTRRCIYMKAILPLQKVSNFSVKIFRFPLGLFQGTLLFGCIYYKWHLLKNAVCRQTHSCSLTGALPPARGHTGGAAASLLSSTSSRPQTAPRGRVPWVSHHLRQQPRGASQRSTSTRQAGPCWAHLSQQPATKTETEDPGGTFW